MKQSIVALALLVSPSWLGAASVDDPQAVGAELDARLFAAYNECRLADFGGLLASDVEFFHGKGGLMSGRQSVVDAVEKHICGKVRREPVAGTLKSHVMDNYGIVQLGEHRFCTVGSDQCNGVARFVHLWKKTDAGWQVVRIISYDHQSM